jgi:hypothetical protein
MDKKLGGLLAVFFLMFVVFVTVLFLSNSGQLASITKAKDATVPSAKDSLLFGFPLLLKADGKTTSTINIFVRSATGMPVKAHAMTITSSLGDLSATNVTTDDQGKASVTLSSTSAGTATVKALIDGTMQLTQTLTIKFQ